MGIVAGWGLFVNTGYRMVFIRMGARQARVVGQIETERRGARGSVALAQHAMRLVRLKWGGKMCEEGLAEWTEFP